jgi:hypothetical protein
MAEWFWWGITMACMSWYAVITLYVAIKGAGDIRGMFSRLAAKQQDAEAEQSP